MPNFSRHAIDLQDLFGDVVGDLFGGGGGGSGRRARARRTARPARTQHRRWSWSTSTWPEPPTGASSGSTRLRRNETLLGSAAAAALKQRHASRRPVKRCNGHGVVFRQSGLSVRLQQSCPGVRRPGKGHAPTHVPALSRSSGLRRSPARTVEMARFRPGVDNGVVVPHAGTRTRAKPAIAGAQRGDLESATSVSSEHALFRREDGHNLDLSGGRSPSAQAALGEPRSRSPSLDRTRR